jgi:hypothetical protein
MPEETLTELRAVRAAVDVTLTPSESRRLIDAAIRLLPTPEAAADVGLPARSLAPIGAAVEAAHGVPGRGRYAAALVAELCLRRALLLERSTLPASVLDLYPSTFARMAAYLGSADLSTYWVGDDPFLKDLRIAAGYTVPGGAQDIDLVGRISKKSGLKAMVTSRAFRTGMKVMRTGGLRWFSIHTDQRYLEEFNADGRDRCYLRIAELLLRDSAVKGMVGTSWYYDPALPAISPRLAYLQQRPLDAGAFLVRRGRGAIHTQRATLTSETRRKLYKEGKYLPVCYSLVWPRDALIAWAERAAEKRPPVASTA